MRSAFGREASGLRGAVYWICCVPANDPTEYDKQAILWDLAFIQKLIIEAARWVPVYAEDLVTVALCNYVQTNIPYMVSQSYYRILVL